MAHLLLRDTDLGDVDAVLFDKDGTMSHSEPMLERLAGARVEQTLAAAGRESFEAGRQRTLRDLLERAYGIGPDGIDPAGITAVASRRHNLLATATALAQVGMGWPEALRLSEEVFQRTDPLQHPDDPLHHPQPTTGLLPLLDQLRGSGVRCAVISNDHEPGIKAFLRRHGLDHHFQALWSADHHPRKPDPAAVRALCSSLDTAPARCALIGDANSDLLMARSAGVAVVLGYVAGWRQPTLLDTSFPHLADWRDLQVRR